MGDSKKEEVMMDTQKPATGLSTNNTRPITESYDHMERRSGKVIISNADRKPSDDKAEKKK